MNVRMWNHPATQRNLATLKADGTIFVGPGDGEMACGEFGPGRMAEPLEIVAAIENALAMPGPLSGMKALVTAGPTQEPLDPVRYLANRSYRQAGLRDCPMRLPTLVPRPSSYPVRFPSRRRRA